LKQYSSQLFLAAKAGVDRADAATTLAPAATPALVIKSLRFIKYLPFFINIILITFYAILIILIKEYLNYN
jgi:hypothetical protein